MMGARPCGDPPASACGGALRTPLANRTRCLQTAAKQYKFSRRVLWVSVTVLQVPMFSGGIGQGKAPEFLCAKTAENRKIRAVGGEHLCLWMPFREHDERGVSHVHRGIFEHEFLSAMEVFGPWPEQFDGTSGNQREKGVDRLGVATKMPTCLSQNHFAGVERSFYLFKN